MSEFQNTKMSISDYSAELYYNPIFNFIDFLKKEKFTDCKVEFPDTMKKPIKAHAAILANSSIPFRNAMEAGGTVTFEIYDDPMDLFPKVLDYLYSGEIQFIDEELMPLLHIAKVYNIPSLKDRLLLHLENVVNRDNIFDFYNVCYNYGLISEAMDETESLIPYFVSNFNQLSIDNFSQCVDVFTFCKVLSLIPTLTNQEKIDYLDQFIGDYVFDDEDGEDEMNACMSLFNLGSREVRTLLSGNHRWIPNGSLK